MERLNGEEISGSEEIKLGLIEYLKGVKVGDVKYQAFFDYFTESDLNSELVRMTDKKSTELNLYELSRLRISENRIVLQEHVIEQKNISLPGYDDAYTEVWINFDNLGAILHSEAREKYPNDENKVKDYASKQWDEIKDQIINLLHKCADSQIS